jgi:hypothetical protein
MLFCCCEVQILLIIKDYFEQSEISKKVLGFANKYIPAVGGGSDTVSTHVSALSIVEAFLTTLTNADSDGRIVIQRPGIEYEYLFAFA